MNKQAGFTLVELLIVVAIAGVLALLAYPGYSQHMVKARRAEAQFALLSVMQQQENFFTYHNVYQSFSRQSGSPDEPRFRWWSGATAAASAYEISGHACPGVALERCIELRATPGTDQVNGRFRDPECGTLTLDSVGRRGASGPRQDCWR